MILAAAGPWHVHVLRILANCGHRVASRQSLVVAAGLLVTPLAQGHRLFVQYRQRGGAKSGVALGALQAMSSVVSLPPGRH